MSELTRRALSRGTAKLVWDVASRSLGFLLTVILARSLGATGFGEFAVYWYSAFVLAQVSDLGLHLSALRELSRDRASTVLGSAVAVKTAVSALLLAGTWLASPSPLVSMLLVSQLLGSWVELFGAALRSRGLLAREGLIVASLRATWIVAALLTLSRGSGLETVAAGLAAASGLAFLVAVVVTWMSLPSWGKPSRERARRLVRESLPLATTTLITLLYLRADLFIVSYFHGPHETGVFQSAFRLLEACFVFSGGLAAGTFPMIAEHFGTPDFRPLARFVLGWAAVLAAPPAIAFAVFSRPVIGIIYGDAFLDAATPLAILGAALFAVFTNSVSTHCLVAAGRTRRLAGAMSVRLVVGIAIDLVLVPRYGAAGAAVAIVVAEWSLTVVSLTMLADLVRSESIPTAPPSALSKKELSSCS